MYEPLLVPKVVAQPRYAKAFLSLGELVVAKQPTYVWTVLGSCVSVVLYSSRQKVSALCHAQLAETDVFGKFGMSEVSRQYMLRAINNDFRYVGCSINFMLEQLLELGIYKNEIVASVYGGANVIAQFSHKIGDENLSVAFDVLAENGIKIVKKDVGGQRSRTIRHFSDTGVTNVSIL